jgi:hypothetical protein
MLTAMKAAFTTVDRSASEQEQMINVFKVELSKVTPQDDKLLRFCLLALEYHNVPKADSEHLKNRFPGTIHCEMVLATMAIYPDRAIQNGNHILKDIAKVIVFSKSRNQSDHTW